MEETVVIDKSLRNTINLMTPVRAREIVASQVLVMGEPQSMAAAQVVDECAAATEAAFSYANRERAVRRYVKKGIEPARLRKFLPQVIDEAMGKLSKRVADERVLAEAARRSYRSSATDYGYFECPLCSHQGSYHRESGTLTLDCCLGEFTARLTPKKQEPIAERA